MIVEFVNKSPVKCTLGARGFLRSFRCRSCLYCDPRDGLLLNIQHSTKQGAVAPKRAVV